MTNHIDNQPSAFPVLFAYKDGLIPQVTDKLVTFISEADTLLSNGRAREIAAAIVYAFYLDEYETMMKDERAIPAAWFESLWDFMMDSTQDAIQHILVRITSTRSLLDDTFALQAGDLHMTSTLRPVTRYASKSWITESIETAR